MRRRTLLLTGLALAAGCGGERARQLAVPAPTPASLTPSASPSPSSRPSVTAPDGPLVSPGRAAQGPVQVQRGAGWVGLPSAYAYTNRTRYDCAQAAVATVRTTTGEWQWPDRGGPDQQDRLSSRWPPDVLGGVWGSSPRLVRRMLGGAGGSTVVRGMDGLRTALSAGTPVVVLLDLRPLGRGTGAHWTVVVAVGEQHVQVTNLGGGLVRRDAFERAWRGLVPTLSAVASTGLVPA